MVARRQYLDRNQLAFQLLTSPPCQRPSFPKTASPHRYSFYTAKIVLRGSSAKQSKVASVSWYELRSSPTLFNSSLHSAPFIFPITHLPLYISLEILQPLADHLSDIGVLLTELGHERLVVGVRRHPEHVVVDENLRGG